LSDRDVTQGQGHEDKKSKSFVANNSVPNCHIESRHKKNLAYSSESIRNYEHDYGRMGTDSFKDR